MLSDVKYALRQLVKSPGFTLTALLSLGAAARVHAQDVVYCDTLPEPIIYGAGGSAQTGLIGQLASRLAGAANPDDRVTIVYAAPGACKAMDALNPDAEDADRLVKGTASYWDAGNPKAKTCQLPDDGVQAAFGSMQQYAEFCPGVEKLYEGVGDFKGADKIDDASFWEVKCDILIPAALEGQITPERAQRTSAKLVLEGANGPTLPQADDILADRGVLVVPDVICNAGGVTVSYFEWVQDFSSFFWTEDEINVRLDKIMVDALRKIWDTADRHKITLRTATFAVACERILMAREERGLYP